MIPAYVIMSVLFFDLGMSNKTLIRDKLQKIQDKTLKLSMKVTLYCLEKSTDKILNNMRIFVLVCLSGLYCNKSPMSVDNQMVMHNLEE